MNELLTAMMIFIAAHSDLPIPDDLPEIAIRTGQQMSVGTVAGTPPLAAFWVPTNEIWLKKSWNDKTTKNKSILFHEIVHYMQYQVPKLRRKYWNCVQPAEKQAYELQTLWLKENGGRPYWSKSDLKRWTTGCS